jgi:hypothetical protein
VLWLGNSQCDGHEEDEYEEVCEQPKFVGAMEPRAARSRTDGAILDKLISGVRFKSV